MVVATGTVGATHGAAFYERLVCDKTRVCLWTICLLYRKNGTVHIDSVPFSSDYMHLTRGNFCYRKVVLLRCISLVYLELFES